MLGLGAALAPVGAAVTVLVVEGAEADVLDVLAAGFSGTTDFLLFDSAAFAAGAFWLSFEAGFDVYIFPNS